MSIFFILFFYVQNFYKNSFSIFLTDSNYNTYLFDNNEMIFPTKYEYVKLEDVPVELIYILLWSEDRDFFEHNGISIKSLTRAALINIKNFSIVQGGSTLTQQLAKTVYLTNERNIKRKVMDIMLAFFLERAYTKEEILEGYINGVYLGNDISGFGAASKRYFGKDVESLNIQEMLVLVGIINGPEIYNPYKYPERAKEQAHILLNSLPDNFLMNSKDSITQEIDNLIFYSQSSSSQDKYLNLIYRIKSEEKQIGLAGGGYTIKTTYNKNLFDSVSLDASSSAIVLNNKTGEILSFWGGEFDTFYSKRQIGSAIKPFYYLLAFEKGYQDYTVLPDQPMKFGDWQPGNFDNRFRGNVTLREALINSINIPSIYLAMHIDISPQKSIETITNFLLQDIGLIGNYPNDLTISLGTVETSPHDLAKAYTIFPNYGIIPSTYVISEVYDRKGNLIYKRYPKIERKVNSIKNESYSKMNSLLRSVVLEGTAKSANIKDIELHGKTGTSEESAWFVGYTGKEVFSVIVKGKNILSSTTAVPISKNIAMSFLYLGESKGVPAFSSLQDMNGVISFFDEPLEFVASGEDVLTFLNSIKFNYSYFELKKKIEDSVSSIEFIYPDVAKLVLQWENENLVDFLEDPYAFIQNGYDLKSYLDNLTLNQNILQKLQEIYYQLKYIYPDQAKILEDFLSSKNLADFF